MTPQTPSQFAICSWCTSPKDPADLASRIKELGLTKTQLHVSPAYLEPQTWGNVQADLAAQGIAIISGMFGTKGEDYSNLETIRKTGGFIPDEHWAANWETVQRVAETAGKMKLKLVSTHAGFLPSDPNDPNFPKLADRLAQVAKHLNNAGITLLFETGQETADTLWQFLQALDQPGRRTPASTSTRPT